MSAADSIINGIREYTRDRAMYEPHDLMAFLRNVKVCPDNMPEHEWVTFNLQILGYLQGIHAYICLECKQMYRSRRREILRELGLDENALIEGITALQKRFEDKGVIAVTAINHSEL